jgi:hypothetical protein
MVSGLDRDEEDRPPDFWAYARIACHGHVQYLRCPGD